MKSYTVKYTSDIRAADVGHVDTWHWAEYAEARETEFRVVHTDDRLIAALRCYEADPVARVTERHGNVCNDSCMEFFFTPVDGTARGYFNFEINSNPTYLLEYRQGEDDEIKVNWDDSDMPVSVIKATTEDGRDYWQIDLEIPYAMIRSFVPEATLERGDKIRGNIYKCGRTAQTEHYGSWNPVMTEGPNFHMPEYFGEFVLE